MPDEAPQTVYDLYDFLFLHVYCHSYITSDKLQQGLRAVEDVLKPPGSLLATDRSKAVVLV